MMYYCLCSDGTRRVDEDGNTYPPVTIEEAREWAAEGGYYEEVGRYESKQGRKEI